MKDVTVPAKVQCFDAFIANNSECKYYVVESGSTASPDEHSYGCRTYIVYAWNTAECLAAYQAQEKTNEGCALYKSDGLGDKAFRMNHTAPTSDSLDCPSEKGPCTHEPNPAGYYHLSCYAANVTADVVAAAKGECLLSFLDTAEGMGCIPVPPASDLAHTSGHGYFGCGTYIGYGFTTQECLAAYQKQEKTNTGCKKYISAELGAASNRNTADTPSSYECEAVEETGVFSGHVVRDAWRVVRSCMLSSR